MPYSKIKKNKRGQTVYAKSGKTIGEMIHERKMNSGLTPDHRVKIQKQRQKTIRAGQKYGAAAQVAHDVADDDIQVLYKGGIGVEEDGNQSDQYSNSNPKSARETKGTWSLNDES